DVLPLDDGSLLLPQPPDEKRREQPERDERREDQQREQGTQPHSAEMHSSNLPGEAASLHYAPSHKGSRMGRRSMVAASVGGVALLAAAAWLWHSTLTTPPEPRVQRLSDGVEVFYRTDSKLEPAAGYPTPRELQVDGDFFFRIPDAPSPLTLRSRLLVL